MTLGHWPPGLTGCGQCTPRAGPQLLPSTLRSRGWPPLGGRQGATAAEAVAATSVGEAATERRFQPIRVLPLLLAAQLPPTLPPLLWPGSHSASVSSTGIFPTKPRSARVPAAGETSCPGTSQRHRPWATCPRRGPEFQEAFSCGHWGQFLHFSSSPVIIVLKPL